MAQISYRETDGEYAGIKAANIRAEAERMQSMTWEETVMEAHEKELHRLENELRKLHAVAAQIPAMEALIRSHREKSVRFKEQYT